MTRYSLLLGLVIGALAAACGGPNPDAASPSGAKPPAAPTAPHKDSPVNQVN